MASTEDGGRVATRHSVAALILGSAAVRLWLDARIGPSVDESYAVVMSRRLALSYYDHPPFLFWIPGLAARLAGSEAPLVVRLPFVLMFMGTTWLLYRVAALLFGKAAGLWSAVVLNLALFFSFSAAAWVLPDGPLLLASAAAALFLARATIAPPPEERGRLVDWVGFGICSGLGLLSKYHAAFLLLGMFAFLATSPRHRPLLKRPGPYVAVGLAVLLFLPVVVWNARNGWVSIRFQGGRALPLPGERDTPLLDSILGQATWILPWIWLPLLVVLASALRRGPRDAARWLLACLGAGPVVFFTLVAALGRRGLPHWQAPGYFMLLPLLGSAVAARMERRDPWVGRWLWLSTSGLALVLAALVTHVSSGWIAHAAPSALERGDPTDDLLQWRPVVRQLRRWGYPRPDVPVVGATWADAAKLAYALGPGTVVGSVGPDPRGFEYVESQASLLGRTLLLVARRRAGSVEPMVSYGPYFDRITPLGTIPIPRQEQEGVTVSVYLAEHLLRPVPTARRR